MEDKISSATKLPAGIPSNADILKVMKDVLLQAGIEPYLDGGSDTPVNVRYDLAPRIGELLEAPKMDEISSEEAALVSHPDFKTKKIRIFIVNSGSHSNNQNGYAKPPFRSAFIYANNFAGGGFDPTANMEDLKYSCAHELGHILELSTRNRGTGRRDSHDSGRIPRVIVYNDKGEYLWQTAPVGLMQPYGTSGGTARRWLRHEDWKKANETAQKIVVSSGL